MEENYRKHYWWISIIIIVTSTIIGYKYKFYEKQGDLTALIDVTLTSIALIIAILEILMLRNIAESSKIAVNNALDRVSEIISVSDISKGIKTAYDIQKYLKSENPVIAHIRMQDLKSIVIPLKNDRRFVGLEISKKLPLLLSTLSIDIKNVDAHLIAETNNKTINIPKINGNLEELVSVLLEYESHIKTLI